MHLKQIKFQSLLALYLQAKNVYGNESGPDKHVQGHYMVHDTHSAFENDLTVSSKGCLFQDLPTEYAIEAGEEYVDVPTGGTWNCTTRDVSDKGRRHPYRDMCNLVCNDGYGLRRAHLQDENHEFIDGYKIKSSRVVCRRNRETKSWEWAPVKGADEWPRCHNTCGDLALENTEDAKAALKCRNLGAIESEFCTPGVNCHHAATCYATCDDGFQTENAPKGTNEMMCICTSRKCGWKVPDDIQTLGSCKFVMRSHNKRIIGGDTAGRNITDWTDELAPQVSCGVIDSDTKQWQHICGGVLLTASWAFTAAHCRTAGMRVILGELDFELREGTEVACRVKSQIRHYDYDQATQHDIMMLYLQCRRLRMTPDFIWPARLPRPGGNLPVGDECTICGWGTMEYPQFEPATELQCVDLPMIDRDVCNVHYNGAIHDNIICIGNLDAGGQDSCQGDSGGGAYCNGIAYALVMGGLYCADADFPGVYTIISHYVPWAVTVIRQHITTASRSRCRRCRGRRSIPDFSKHNKNFYTNGVY